MKTSMKHKRTEVEFAAWQLFALIIGAVACVFAVAPFILQYRANTCDVVLLENVVKPQSNDSNTILAFHQRYVRDVGSLDECGIVPPMCSATTTVPGISTASPTTTTRTTVSTVSVTRPVITSYATSAPTTTPDPWQNITKPYNSWRLPTFAKPVNYDLRISCPECFILLSNITKTPFYGQVSISIDVTNTTDYLVLHSKNLNITQAKLTEGGSATASITYLPEYEMIYLYFGPSAIAMGQIKLQIDFTGIVNEVDNTGLYLEYFWKSIGELSYLLAGYFQPTHARKAFPCFDEPNMQATFTLTLEHPTNETIALSNSEIMTKSDAMTKFQETFAFSTYSLAWAVLPLNEFKSVSQTYPSTKVNVWVRPELIAESNKSLELTFEIVQKTLEFMKDYLNLTDSDLPTKLDLIGVPDLTLDEKASATWGLLTFREEILITDESLESAERLQTRTKAIVEHILQIWFTTTDWWNNIWFGKSLSSFLAYKMIEQHYSAFKLMEQFPVREMVPFMMEDLKPSIWPVANKNFKNNDEIIDYLSVNIYSKGASFLRLLEYMVGEETFQTAAIDLFSVVNVDDILTKFYSHFDFPTLFDTTVTAEEFLRSWLEERNYPIVSVEFITSNETTKNTTLVFYQSRYYGSLVLNDSSFDPNYAWKIYMECDLGGIHDGDNWNVTDNYVASKLKFIFDSPIHTIELLNEDYLWIKCNKGFYSYYVTEYLSYEEDDYVIWQYFEELFNENIFSTNDKANLLNDAFILPHGGENVTYEQTASLVRQMYDQPVAQYLPWSVFAWHWQYLMGVEEHSQYFWNFKQFTTRQIYNLYEFNIDNIVTSGTTHQEKLLKSIFFELLCRVQNTEALNKATELFRKIPISYFQNSSGDTNVDPNYLQTAMYYHIQNVNDIDEWDYLWINFTENEHITSQQRIVTLRALSAAKEIWRLKNLLEMASDMDADIIEVQELFDLIAAISQNPNGRDVVWNFYRHNYERLIDRFGRTNRLFNQLITNIAQSFENRYYYSQMVNFINDYPSPSKHQKLALDQIQMNYEWLNDGMARSLDDALSAVDHVKPEKTQI